MKSSHIVDLLHNPCLLVSGFVKNKIGILMYACVHFPLRSTSFGGQAGSSLIFSCPETKIRASARGLFIAGCCLILTVFSPRLKAEEGYSPPQQVETHMISIEKDDPGSSLALSWKAQIEDLLHRARIALRLQKPDVAEQFFIEALNKQIPDADRKSILLEMASLFEGLKRYAKLSAVYEKYIDLYPKDEKVLELYFKLAEIYKAIGAPEKAIERYYNVLNLSLSAHKEELNDLKAHTLEAQISIAETYLAMGKYAEAKLFFSRIQHLKLPKDKEEAIDFKLAHCAYAIQDYKSALLALQDFIYKYPQSHNLPEAHFMLADTYKGLNMQEKAQEALKTLLSLPQTATSQGNLLFWQKKTANELANAFYKKGDAMAALRVYQAMLSLSATADWQWPILYQMGLCYEKLSMYPKAQEAYGALVYPENESSSPSTIQEPLSDYLKSIQDMAQWRKDHLGWMMESESQVQALFKMPQVASPSQK